MGITNAAMIAKSGLNALTAEVSVLSRNIAGASSTTLFSRKIANVTTGIDGSLTVSVTRASNLAVFESLLSATSASAAQDALSAGLETLNQTIGDISSTTPSATSPAALLTNFTNALQSYEASPSDSSLASAAVNAAAALAQGLNSATATVSQARAQADAQIATSVQTINSLLNQFQAVNTQIVNGMGTGADVADAQDSRDNIVQALSKEIGITVTTDANGSMSIYTDGGLPLYQGGIPRSVTFVPTSTYTAGTVGNSVYVDGVPVTGSSAVMPSLSGNIVGLANLRDQVAVTYQAQLDNIASGLITTFAESDQNGPGPNLPGLFTAAGAASLPTSTTGLAGQIAVNPSVDPNQGGNPFLLRDGAISGNSNYVYNKSGDAGYQGRLSQLLANLSATQTFSAAGGIAANLSLGGYASASVSWLEAQRSSVASQSTYQSTLLNTATTALSNATGVNLDNEMSKMLDLENSYSATAKLLSTIDGLFGTFLTDLGNLPA